MRLFRLHRPGEQFQRCFCKFSFLLLASCSLAASAPFTGCQQKEREQDRERKEGRLFAALSIGKKGRRLETGYVAAAACFSKLSRQDLICFQGFSATKWIES